MRELSPKARIYVAGLTACAFLLIYLAITQRVDYHDRPYLFDFAWFGAMFLIAELFPVLLPNGGAYSVSFVIALAAIVTHQGPSLAAPIAAFAALNLRKDRDGRTPVVRRVFNGSQLVIATTAAGSVYISVSDALGLTPLLPSLSPPHNIFATPAVLIPIFAAAAAYFIVNTWLVAIMLALVADRNPARLWAENFSKLIGADFAFALLGYLLGALNIMMGPPAVLFLFVPLVVARHAFQASVRMVDAYDRTVLSLMQAIEKKDAYTRGHAERVARLSQMVAREMTLREDQVRLVRFAALMHDVGKLGVSTRILQKPGKLTADEYEHMKDHPIRGHEIVDEIDFLRDAVGAVRHHHERMDGGGYPDGLVGEQIPLLARIIMVSDAFDSMTSTRVYRKAKSFDEALQELHRCEGTQFDPVSLAALERAIGLHGWEAFPEEEEVTADATVAGL